MIGFLLSFAYVWGMCIWKAILYPQLLLLQAIYAVVAVPINPQKRIAVSVDSIFAGTSAAVQ